MRGSKTREGVTHRKILRLEEFFSVEIFAFKILKGMRFSISKGLTLLLEPIIEVQCANGFLKVSVFEKDVALTVLAGLYIMQSKLSKLSKQ